METLKKLAWWAYIAIGFISMICIAVGICYIYVSALGLPIYQSVAIYGFSVLIAIVIAFFLLEQVQKILMG